ncbi:MAG: zinc-ribbon domain-containing protein [Candidatus Methanomethylophilaceae archaeon]
MSDSGSTAFCTKCGTKLRESAAFCPECGAPVAGGSVVQSVRNEINDSCERKAMTERLMWVSIFLGIFVLFSVVIGAYCAFDVNVIMETLKSDPDVWSELLTHYTETEIRNAFVLVGYYVLLAGVVGAVSLILCVTKRFWIVALVTCAAASILMLPTIIGPIIGLIVSYLLYTAKPAFFVS